MPRDATPLAPTLVFLHEGLGSIAQWKDFPIQLCLATRMPGLAYDRWGFGRSEPLDRERSIEYLNHEAEISLPAVLEQCQIDNPILIGHSDGGSIALIFAAAYPTRPRAIVTEAAHVFVEQVTLDGIRAAVNVYESTNLRDRLARYHGDNTERMFRGWSDIWLSPSFHDWNIEHLLPKITCPSLIMQGEDDEYGTDAQVDSIVRQVSGPAMRLMIPGCAHIPHHQARDRVLDEISRFATSLPDGRVP